MKNKIIVIVVLLLMVSCSTFKSVAEKDTSTKDTTTEIVETTKKGGVTSLSIPKYNYILKDTVIERINYKTKTILRTVFDKEGNQKTDCYESEINERVTRIEENQQNNIEANSTTKNEFNPQNLIYAIAGLGVVLIIGMVVFSYFIIKIKKEIIS